ncbi:MULTISPECIES: hypothetical protein [Sorangium]|uniref:Uncharacterized protein n=1 Tax=Sorangium cellulosum TaxID=56 RepID=A0A4P2R3S3_SORCE|nr:MULTISPECIES: hypothetical protein [Sorangium]AUX36633.1 hypothetical protein SOCE836_088410 [Sorangium cellulosum]WCQ95931.1 hypothetical protein NQZ70_08708 [Sorangium sp. Soce836]
MIPALTALKAAVLALLEARGERGVSALVAGAELALAGPPQRWTMGSREVSALRLSLAVDAPAFAALTADGARLAAAKDAFASAVRTPETELADLTLVLRLPGVGRGWNQVYREAALPAATERPPPDAVLGGAAALLEASGDARGAAMLRRARLETAQVPSGGGVALVRCVVRLDPADRAALDRDGERAERLQRAVRSAGARAAEAVASVELATALAPLGGSPPLGPAEAPGARLARALEARGAVVVPVSRDEGGPGGGGVELAVVASGELLRVRIAAPSPGPERGHGGWKTEEIRAITVAAQDAATPERAGELAALLLGGGDLA